MTAPFADSDDVAIGEAVRRELREDSETQFAEVRAGIVHLHGRVSSIDDAENVSEVAARVAGVVDVVDEMEVANV